MENKQVLKYLINRFGFSDNSFNKRMISQKSMYILQEMGLGTNYNFNWYLYGVYSQELADDLFSMNSLEVSGLSESQKEIISKFEELSRDNLENPSFFELVSSTIYLVRINPFMNKEEIFGKIIEFKPHLEDKETFEVVYPKIISLIK